MKTIEHGEAVASETVSDRALGNLLEAPTEPDGAVHVIYADLVSKSEAALKYRRGSFRPDGQQR